VRTTIGGAPPERSRRAGSPNGVKRPSPGAALCADGGDTSDGGKWDDRAGFAGASSATGADREGAGEGLAVVAVATGLDGGGVEMRVWLLTRVAAGAQPTARTENQPKRVIPFVTAGYITGSTAEVLPVWNGPGGGCRERAVARFAAARRVAVASICLGLLQIAGCTSLLGIDGEYGLASGGDGGRAAGSGGRHSNGGNGSGDSGAGGASIDSSGGSGAVAPGGTSGGGGSGGVIEPSSGGGAGAPPIDAGAGGAPPDLGPCTPGAYEGTQSGSHTPTLTFVVPFNVTGTVAFRLDGADGGAATIADGNVNGYLEIVSSTPFKAQFTATLSGTVDCTTGSFHGVLDGGSTGPQSINFHGHYVGAFSGGNFSGNWDEMEPKAPPTGPTGKGNGKWDAHWTRN
jgi:hypothetical protein